MVPTLSSTNVYQSKKIPYLIKVPEKKQFKMYLEPEIVERLTGAGKKFGRGTPQQVVEELIDVYFPLWVTVNTATQRALDRQTRSTFGKDYRVFAKEDDLGKGDSNEDRKRKTN